jgi:hypothetical protein
VKQNTKNEDKETKNYDSTLSNYAKGERSSLDSNSIILIQSIHLLFDCTKEVGLPGLEGGWGASENLSISLFPNLPTSN